MQVEREEWKWGVKKCREKKAWLVRKGGRVKEKEWRSRGKGGGGEKWRCRWKESRGCGKA